MRSYHTKSQRTSGHSPNPPVPSPAASIAAASPHLIRRDAGAAASFAAHCRRLRNRLASIATVAAGLGFAMYTNQPEAEAAQRLRQRGILRVDAVSRDTQYLPHPHHGGSVQGGGAVHHNGAVLSISDDSDGSCHHGGHGDGAFHHDGRGFRAPQVGEGYGDHHQGSGGLVTPQGSGGYRAFHAYPGGGYGAHQGGVEGYGAPQGGGGCRAHQDGGGYGLGKPPPQMVRGSQQQQQATQYFDYYLSNHPHPQQNPSNEWYSHQQQQ